MNERFPDTIELLQKYNLAEPDFLNLLLVLRSGSAVLSDIPGFICSGRRFDLKKMNDLVASGVLLSFDDYDAMHPSRYPLKAFTSVVFSPVFMSELFLAFNVDFGWRRFHG